jgi:predicted permease
LVLGFRFRVSGFEFHDSNFEWYKEATFMTSLRAFLSRLAGAFHKSRRDRELDAELDTHLRMQTDANIRYGMSPEEARRQALIRSGGIESAKESYRERSGLPLLETLLQDLRFAGRVLRKNLSFTVIAVLTLALGIGANTAIFSMVNALLLHPYTFRDLDRIVLVWQDQGSDVSFDQRYMAPGDAFDFASNAGVFEELATYECHAYTLGSTSELLPADGCNVSANFFHLLGAAPALGRSFAASEEQPGRDAVVVLAQAFWQRHFGGDPSAIGKSIQMNGRTYTVIGVMPAQFNFPVAMQLWVPLAMTRAERADRSRLSIAAIGRLRPGISIAQARTALAAFNARLTSAYPKTNAGRRTTLLQLRRELYQFTLPLFSLLQVAAAFVLLLACANLGNLLFARMVGRQKEIALRAALGAGRRRLAQLFVSETILFSVIAGIVAVAVSLWTVKLLRTSISPEWTKWVPGWSGIQVNRSVLAFTILLATIVGIFFGLATLAHAGRVDLNQTLKEGGPGSMARARARLRSTLVVAQVVFALVLLVCAGLTIQGFMRLANLYAGFQPETVMEFQPVLHASFYRDSTKIANFYEQLLRQTAALPGVTAAALVGNPPASNVNNDTSTFEIEGRPTPRPGEALSADLQIASPEYFRALRISMVSGRAFSDADNGSTEPVAIVSRSMAIKFWPHADALGQHVRLIDEQTQVDLPKDRPSAGPQWLTIVGVVDDVRQNWWNSSAQPTIYRPLLQAPERGMMLVLRVTANPAGYVSLVRPIVRQLDSTVALDEIHTLQSEVTDSIGIIRIMGTLMGIFGGVALALSAIGVYGVLSESVAQRRREIGIRVALGASPPAVRQLILGQALKLTGIGLLIAVPVALAINRAMASLVFGIVSMDLAIIAEFTVVLLLVALAAGYFPARRAMRVDPMVSLRYE